MCPRQSLSTDSLSPWFFLRDIVSTVFLRVFSNHFIFHLASFIRSTIVLTRFLRSFLYRFSVHLMSCSSRPFRVPSSNLFRLSLHRWPTLSFELVLTRRSHLAVFLTTILNCHIFPVLIFFVLATLSQSYSFHHHRFSLLTSLLLHRNHFDTLWAFLFNFLAVGSFSFSSRSSRLFSSHLFRFFLLSLRFCSFSVVLISCVHSLTSSLRSFSLSSVNSVPFFKRSTATHPSPRLSLRCRNPVDFLLTINPNDLAPTRLFDFFQAINLNGFRFH